MIPGFEEYTYKLTEYERQKLLPLLINLLNGREGKEKAILNREILEEFSKQFDKDNKPFKISDARVRKLINHIRTNGIITGLIATSKGYYISKDAAEVQRYIKSLYYRSEVISVLGDHMKLHLQKIINTPAA
jgi:hypothetical protein